MFLNDQVILDDKIAIISQDGKQRTYRDLEQISESLNSKLKKRSIVFILCDFHIDTLSFYYGLLDNKIVPLLLDEKIDGELLTQLIDNYHPKYLWLSKKYLELFQKDFNVECDVLLEYEDHSCLKLGFEVFPITEELALLLETSGSTGGKKLVRLSYDNIKSNIFGMVDFIKVEEEDRFITTMPYNHCLTLTWIHMHWFVGATVLLTNNSVLSQEFWDFLYEKKATNFVGVPFLFEMLEKIDFLNKEYFALRYVAEAGGKLPEELQKKYGLRLKEKGIGLYLAYGQTEVTGGICILSTENIVNKVGSVGIPLCGIDVVIEEDSGDIIVKGKSVCLGYAENIQDLAKGDENKGRWLTGDVGHLDGNGFLYITGRKKRFIKVSGIRISLDDVEQLLNGRKVYGACACIGRDNLLQVFTEIENTQAILEFLANKIHINKTYIKIEHIKTIPRTSTGKIQYTQLFTL